MSLSAILTNSVASLRAFQSGVGTISNNVANAQNPDYARRETTFQSKAGISVYTDVQRIANERLSDMVAGERSKLAHSQTMADIYQSIAGFTGTAYGEGLLAEAVDEFDNAWKAFQASPQSAAVESDLIRAADALASTIRGHGEGLRLLETEVRDRTEESVKRLNDQLSELARLNREVKSNVASGREVPELLDQVDALIGDISRTTDLRILRRTDGTVSLYTQSGLTLVDVDATRLEWTGEQLMAGGVDVTGRVTGGELGALLQAQSPNTSHPTPEVGVLAKLGEQLEYFAIGLTDAIEGGFRQAYDSADDPTLRRDSDLLASFFVSDSSPPRTAAETIAVNADLLSGAATVKRDAATPVVDQLAAPVLDYTSAARTVEVNATRSASGDLHADEFAIQRADGFSTGRVSSLTLTVEPAAGRGQPARLVLRDDSGGEAVLTGDRATGTGPFSFVLDGGPNSGATVELTLGRELAPGQSAELGFSVRGRLNTGGMGLGDRTYSAMAADIAAFHSSQQSVIEARAERQDTTLKSLETRLNAETGVDIDKEVAELIVFQNSYAAAARLLSTVNQMFDTMINIGR